MSEELLAGDGGDEVLEIEGFEIGDILKLAFLPGLQDGVQHRGGFRITAGKMRIRVGEDFAAFLRSVADEKDGTFRQQRIIAARFYDFRFECNFGW